MGRNWARRASKIAKRRKWGQSNKAVSNREPKKIIRQRRQKSKEEAIWDLHEGDIYEQ